VKWGDLEPKTSSQDVEAGGGVKITINLGESTHQMTQVIEHDETDAQLVDAG
jgi:hypothetical protein